MNEKLELRMYGLVPCNISPIQQAIQFGHAVVEYGQMAKRQKNKVEWHVTNDGEKYFNVNFQDVYLGELYDEWADNSKTFIILNGGTTNNRITDDGFPFGSLNQHVITLDENKVDFATFNEPDLGDQLTAVVFIVDERVFNRKKYPDFEDWVVLNYGDLIRGDKLAKRIKESNSKKDKKVYQSWVNLVGGEKNVFLRDFLNPKNFKLA
jgi:hypothetical protein